MGVCAIRKRDGGDHIATAAPTRAPTITRVYSENPRDRSGREAPLLFAPSLWPVDVELVVVVVVAKDPVGVGVGLIVFVFVFVFVTGAPLEVGDPVGAGPTIAKRISVRGPIRRRCLWLTGWLCQGNTWRKRQRANCARPNWRYLSLIERTRKRLRDHSRTIFHGDCADGEPARDGANVSNDAGLACCGIGCDVV